MLAQRGMEPVKKWSSTHSQLWLTCTCAWTKSVCSFKFVPSALNLCLCCPCALTVLPPSLLSPSLCPLALSSKGAFSKALRMNCSNGNTNSLYRHALFRPPLPRSLAPPLHPFTTLWWYLHWSDICCPSQCFLFIDMTLASWNNLFWTRVTQAKMLLIFQRYCEKFYS